MPELTSEAVQSFWKEYNDEMIYRVINFMEEVEDWTADGNPELERAINDLGVELDGLNRLLPGKEDNFIDLVNHLKTSRGLRILQTIDTAHPGAASKILMYAEENTDSDQDPAGLFLRRNIIFERLRLLGRVFSPERFNVVLRALESSDS